MFGMIIYIMFGTKFTGFKHNNLRRNQHDDVRRVRHKTLPGYWHDDVRRVWHKAFPDCWHDDVRRVRHKALPGYWHGDVRHAGTGLGALLSTEHYIMFSTE